MSTLMKAAIAGEQGLAIADIPRPTPGDEQVLVKVAAAGLNRADLAAATASGKKDGWGKAIGMEWAGEIVEVGRNVRDMRAGDRVMCYGLGGYAEYAVADMGCCLKLDGHMDFADAAVVPLVLMTAHDAVVTNGGLSQGDAILVQGASSAVGLTALRIANVLGAGVIVGISRDAAKRSRFSEFGATLAFDPKDESWVEAVMEATGGRGVDVVVDMVSGDTVALSMKAAAVRARIVNVGRLGGAEAMFDFGTHALKRLQYLGVTFRTRSLQEVRDIVGRVQADLWKHIAAGRFSLPIDRSFRLEEAVEAHRHMSANRHFGKIVLVP